MQKTKALHLVQYQGYTLCAVQRYRSTQIEQTTDYVLQEYPVALVYNGISHVVMMVTPTDLENFARGFSLSEGVIDHIDQLYAIDIKQHDQGISVEMQISNRAFMALKQQRRALVGRSGCGLCGIEHLTALEPALPRIQHHYHPTWLAQLPQALAALKQGQHLTALTGGAHAAAWVVDGTIVELYEDVGRHNALDKLLGAIAHAGYDKSQGYILMTSRASYELIRKCARSNIALLACISAPSSLAVQLAQHVGLCLLSFCREQQFVMYNDPLA